MTTTDANGIVFLQTTDNIAPFHTLINGLQTGTTNAVTTLKNRVTALESENGPSWTSYTPAWYNVTLGSSTRLGRFRVVNGTVEVQAQLTLGTGFVVGSTVTVSLPRPINLSIGWPNLGECMFSDAGTGYFAGWLRPNPTGVEAVLMADGTGNAVGTSIPFTWAVGDVMNVYAKYPLG